jgi:isoquinoline 1-oxidoreductase subunit beta
MGISRRWVIGTGLAAGGGFIVYSVSRMLDTGGDGEAPLKFAATTPDAAALNAWIKITPDGTVTFAVHRAEMGQGVTTSLPMLLAEELDADWARIRYEFSPLDKDYYNFGVLNRGRPFGEVEDRYWAGLGTSILRRAFHARGDSLTLSSTSIIDAWDTLRPAGAAARAMLVAAAARRWQVPTERLRTELSQVIDDETGRVAGYGELAADAARETPPDRPPLKDPKDYRIVGRPMARLDLPDKVAGVAQYSIDTRLPGMLFGAVAHSPVAGGRIQSFDAAAAKALPGVADVIGLGDVAVAALAGDTWTAIKAARLVRIETVPDAGRVQSATLLDRYTEALDSAEPSVFRDDGDATTELANADGTVTATYQWPYLAHACMEPMSCTALYDAGRLTIWAPTQAISTAQQVAAAMAGLERDQVTVHQTLLGGGFGRRADMDFVERAVAAALQVPGRPVQLTWTREEDMRHDVYRPAGVARAKARLADDGTILALDWVLATQSVVASFAKRTPTPRPSAAEDDVTVAHGLHDLIYRVPNYRLAYVPQDSHVPVGYWRSTSTSYGAFCVESFMDELAAAAGQDPVAFRLANLPADSRHRAVLEHAAERAGWGTALPAGRGRGIALYEKARTVIAQVADVTVSATGKLSVDRVVCVVDPGLVINPDTVAAMMQGGIAYGLNAALLGEITLRDGAVEQGNFHDYPELPLADVPPIDVYLLPQGRRPEGVGETAVPGIAPAVANAVFNATGRRLRALPLGRELAS